jgi:2,5-diketo-D-gluconate reductase B
MKDQYFKLGLGNDRRHDDSTEADWRKAVLQSLETGYRHIDTAQAYGNEEAIGRAIADSDVAREELFIATKLHSDYLSYDDVIECAGERLESLQLEVIDLLYVHWPFAPYDPEETFPAFEELRDRDKIRHIGVCNFSIDLVERAREHVDELFTVQIEMHPLLPQREFIEYANDNDLWIVAHTPLAKGRVLDHPIIRDVAESNNATPAQVTIAWLLENDKVAAIPKATGDHIVENFGALSLELDVEDIRRIDAIEERHRVVDPDIAPWNYE